MPVRALTLAALVVASLVALQPRFCRAQASGMAVAAAALPLADTLAQTTIVAREAYQRAWSRRQAGELIAAAEIADSALGLVDGMLARDLDASSRRELTELSAKLTGFRDAARHDLQSPTPPPGADDEADARVLNAPATESIEPQFNADVHRYITYFTGAGRSVFERWLTRSGRYMNLFREVLKKEGLPPDLVHLVFVESGFNVHARSVSAAVGPWQFLRSTGRLFGLTVNQWVDERKDPEKSTVAAARYLKHLYSIFGDWPLALASYNAGEGTVLRAIKRQGTTNYWDLRLPRQTEDYVPQFMAVLAISRDPQKYGFDDVALDEPMDFDELALRGAVDLRAIAKLAECTYEELRALNPAVLRYAAPAREGVTMLRVPRGKAEIILSRLEGGATLPAADLSVNHRVRRGETLQGIANQYHVNATALARQNGIGRKHPLRRGMVLTVRSDLKSTIEPAKVEPGDPRASTRYVPERARRAPASLNAESDAEGRITVTVRRGETLAAIAERHGVTVQDIKRWNRLKTSQVRRGTRLKIRTGDARTISAETLAADSARVAMVKAPSPRSSRSGMKIKSTIRVKPGDTLGAIASRNGITVAKLKRANGLRSNVVRSGQRLKIPA